MLKVCQRLTPIKAHSLFAMTEFYLFLSGVHMPPRITLNNALNDVGVNTNVFQLVLAIRF